MNGAPSIPLQEQAGYSIEQGCTMTGMGRNQLRMWLILWRELSSETVRSEMVSAQVLYLIARAYAQAKAQPIELGPEQALRNVLADEATRGLSEEQAVQRVATLTPASPKGSTSGSGREPLKRSRGEFERLRLSLVTPNPSPEVLRAAVLWLEQQDVELGKVRRSLALSQLELTHARNEARALERKLIPWWRKLPKLF